MQSRKRTPAEFFAQGYRVSGIFVVTKRLLADVIYDPTTDFVMLEDAYLSPIMDPGRISAHYTIALLQKSNLDFFLTVKTQDGLRRDQHYVRGGSNKYTVYLTVPFFEISGELYSTMKQFHPRSYLSMEAGDFITLLNVTARSTFDPKVSYEGGTAQINRTQISFFGERIS